MLARLPEKKMHLIKWLLAIGWLTLITSLFFDPISPLLTDPNNLASPFRLPKPSDLVESPVPSLGVSWQSFTRFTADPSTCVMVQGKCVEEQPYGMGARIFWAMIVPIGLVIIHIFGHELWRRICPLSFFSQIPRALGIQRKRKVKTETGREKLELVVVDKESWLGRNYLYLQFALFFIGLNLRILFVNSDRLALGIFLLFTIGSAITVGYLFAGKSWCQYFCPMAPVQMVYTGPRGLLDSYAHLGQEQLGITQSMCREVDKSGQEKSACVSCQSPCIDIDSERSYWEKITSPDQKLVYYGYVGLVISFYLYYYLYAGNWRYYYSGAWTHEETQIATLFNPGFYFNGQAIPIPKIIACPLTLGFFCWLTYFIGDRAEKIYQHFARKAGQELTLVQLRHRMFTLSTVIAWNIFWSFGSRPNLALLPPVIERLITGFLVICSGLWLYQTWGRGEEQYQRENLANKLRRQLDKLGFDIAKFLNRKVQELKPDEVFVLAKVLPAVDKQQRLKAYRGVLQEALEEGRTSSSDSLALLEDLREELGIDVNEHYDILKDIGISDPHLLDPKRQYKIETQMRLEAYYRNMESLIVEIVERGVPVAEAINSKREQIARLKEEYLISEAEDQEILNRLLGQESNLIRSAYKIIDNYLELGICDQALRNLPSNPDAPIYRFLRHLNYDRAKELICRFLSILEVLGNTEQAQQLARSISNWSPEIIANAINDPQQEIPWSERIDPAILSLVRQGDNSISTILTTLDTDPNATLASSGGRTLVANRTLVFDAKRNQQESALIPLLEEFLANGTPIFQAASLYGIANLDRERAKLVAQKIGQNRYQFPFIGEIIDRIEDSSKVFDRGQTVIKLSLVINQQKQEFVFTKPTITIGSSANNDMVIHDSRIADHHASLLLNDYGLSIRHMGSGTSIYLRNNEIFNSRVYLSPGDTLKFGLGDEIKLNVDWQIDRSAPSQVIIFEKMLYLFTSQIFSGLPANLLIEIAAKTTMQTYTQGEVILDHGQSVKYLMVLIEGEAEVSLPGQGIVGTVKPGETIGEMGVLTYQPSSAQVIAKTNSVKLLALADKELRHLISCNSSLASNMLTMMSRRLQSTLAKLSAEGVKHD